MITITGYREVKYTELVEAIQAHKQNSGKSDMQIAIEIGVSTQNTVKNINNDEQIVSDKVLTNTMQSIDLEGIVVWNRGQKTYYIKD